MILIECINQYSNYLWNILLGFVFKFKLKVWFATFNIFSTLRWSPRGNEARGKSVHFSDQQSAHLFARVPGGHGTQVAPGYQDAGEQV